MPMPFMMKRVYDDPGADDGARILVERLWPRGVSKDRARLDAWLKEVAPSSTLRHWFGHDPERWEEFRRRYWAELEEKPEAVATLLEAGERGRVTLVYASRDEAHSCVAALKEFLERQR